MDGRQHRLQLGAIVQRIYVRLDGCGRRTGCQDFHVLRGIYRFVCVAWLPFRTKKRFEVELITFTNFGKGIIFFADLHCGNINMQNK